MKIQEDKEIQLLCKNIYDLRKYYRLTQKALPAKKSENKSGPSGPFYFWESGLTFLDIAFFEKNRQKMQISFDKKADL